MSLDAKSKVILRKATPLVGGIQFVVDAEGNPTGVIILLTRHGKLRVDLGDVVIAGSRANEARVLWDEVKRQSQNDRTQQSTRV